MKRFMVTPKQQITALSEDTQIRQIYAVKDRIAKEVGWLFEQNNDASAKRAFVQMFRNTKALSCREYELWNYGYFDVHSHVLVPLPQPIMLDLTDEYDIIDDFIEDSVKEVRESIKREYSQIHKLTEENRKREEVIKHE